MITPAINTNAKGKVTDVTCDQCHKLVPFSQPELSVLPAEASILDHACPNEILVDAQEAIAPVIV